MSKSTEQEYQKRISELQADLSKSQLHLQRYRAILSALVLEAWRNVTPEELALAVENNQGIDDILAELDDASGV